MPEAWGNANAVDLLRDMLVQERSEAPATVESKMSLHLLAGLPAEWISKVGQAVSVDRTPTTLGTMVSLKLTRASETTLRLEVDPGGTVTNTFVHVPLAEGARVVEIKADGRAIPMGAVTASGAGQQAVVAVGTLSHSTIFEIELAQGSAR
jgi:hypothetical protein